MGSQRVRHDLRGMTKSRTATRVILEITTRRSHSPLVLLLVAKDYFWRYKLLATLSAQACPSTLHIPIIKLLIVRRVAEEDGGVEGHALIYSCENSKITTLCWTTINRKMLDPTKKRYPTSKGKGNKHPSKMVGGVKLCLESSPIPARDTRRAQTNFVRTRTQRPHRDWDRTVFECLLRSYGPTVNCCRGRGSGCSRPGCGISPLGGGHH